LTGACASGGACGLIR